MRIVTVTLNPALDKVGILDELRPGELNRMRDIVVDAAGKGINVSRVLASLGGESVATGFIGGGSGEEILRTLDAAGVAHDFVRIAEPNRINLKVLDRDNSRFTELNEPGPVISPEQRRALFAKLEAAAGPDALFVLSGSVANGMGAEVYADIIRMAHRAGAQAWLDADGEAFRLAIGELPEFIKPNRFEILQYHGLGPDSGNDVILRLCRGFIDRGVKRMVVSMGKDGAMFVSRDEAFLCPGLPVKAHSSAGAGDSIVAAVLRSDALGKSWREAAALAMAVSAGSVVTIGTKPPPRELVEELLTKVRFIDL